MELFRISEGPWERLFEGKFQEMDVEIYQNRESVILVLIAEKEGDRVKGTIIELYKVFYSSGETETFTETLPREVIVLTKHNEKETMKFFLLGSKPDYVEWEEDKFIKETDRHLKRLKTSAEMIKDVSKAYDLTLREIAECPERIKEAFFSQPLLVPISATAAHPEVHEEAYPEEVMKSLTKGEIILGLTKDKKRVVEPLTLFTKSAVTGGEDKERKHIMHIIAESCLLSGVTPVIFDWEKEFEGLHEASPDTEKLQKYMVNAEPIGFPVKVFSLGKELKVDLSAASPQGFVEVFGVGKNRSAEIIMSEIKNAGENGIKGIAAKVAGMEVDEKFSIFEIYRAARILRLIDSMYSGVFEGHNDTEDMTKKKARTIGRASILSLKGADPRISKLIIHNIFNGALKHYSAKGKAGLKTMLILPDSEKIISVSEKGMLSKGLEHIIPRLGQYGVGFCLGMENFVEAGRDIKQNIEADINVIKGNDAGVQLKKRKSYRVLIRPALSRSPEVIS
jgi:hypothetical protein